MCEVGKKLKLCTCLTDKDLEVFEAHQKLKHLLKQSISATSKPITWTLHRYIGKVDNSDLVVMGMLDMPSEKLLNSLSNEYVLSQINSCNCFDFDYTPTEGDNLKIEKQRNVNWTEFLSFIFRKGKWEADSYDTFIESIEDINFGKVEIE